jgi:hypothetical protein
LEANPRWSSPFVQLTRSTTNSTMIYHTLHTGAPRGGRDGTTWHRAAPIARDKKIEKQRHQSLFADNLP